MERFGLTRSMSAKGCSPDNAAAEGFFGRMKTEAVYPEKWEEHTRNEVLAPDVYLEVQHPCWSCNSNSSSANASAGVR